MGLSIYSQKSFLRRFAANWDKEMDSTSDSSSEMDRGREASPENVSLRKNALASTI